MPNLGNITKPFKSVFGLSSNLKSRLLKFFKERNINKRRRYAENLIALKDNATKIASNNVNKKTNKSVFGPKYKDIIKDL